MSAPLTGKGAARRGNSPAAFRSRVLDHLVHVHPVTAVVLFAPVVVAGTWLSLGDAGGWALGGWALAGYLAWTLSEYWGHRIVLHFEPERGFGARLHWILHGVHHDYPQDSRRSILSPVLSVPMVAGATYLASGPGGLPLTFGAGYAFGYLSYDLFHLYLHQGRPQNRLLRRLRELHMRHHFRDDTRGFGISAPYWDEVFGTSIARPTRPSRPGDVRSDNRSDDVRSDARAT
ncbi:sterol desaturase family protein [Streptomyces sp. NPDC017979]|uniref:sterol desaturase family protein n=1 Tax=Streptomyces sp. NPDC017979 TaxID=3365024 RepID=UPI0037A2CD7F